MSPLTCSFLLAFTLTAAPDASAPLPAERAAVEMKVPEGFRVRLCAAEPDLVKPIAMTFDDRGRIWVVESHSYPNWLPKGQEGHDRILIFEDRNGTGKFESCTVFWDKGTNISGIAVGFGGVWLCAIPHVLFIPMKPGEDKPGGPPQVVLDGWDMRSKHNVFNTLIWGPDGWLYGCNGIMSNSKVGAPGTADDQRVGVNCGVWRYHPIRKTVELFASGTTNPWGLDFDDYGEMFITNCVIKHMFHVVPGAHFVRMYGQDLNPNTYALMQSTADHIHWAGGDWGSSRGGQGAHGERGGGHAHAGAMVYLGDNWPDTYRNRVFMCNIHGSRVNQDILERHGSGYVAHHGPDLLFATDPWFRGLIISAGPDGGVYVVDWCDTGECHNYDKVHPNGRIYKITHGQPRSRKFDLPAATDDQLVQLQLDRNDWWVRQARRLLQERAANGKLDKSVRPALKKMFTEQREVTRKLRALRALHVIGALDEKQHLELLDHPEEAVRLWTIRLALEEKRASEALTSKLTALARKDSSPAVRLALASGLQRLPLAQRWEIAEGLAAHADDWNDPYLPLMIWYGIEPLPVADSARAVKLLRQARLSVVREHIARRIAAQREASGWSLLVGALDDSNADVQADILRGMYRALAGQRITKPPAEWATVRGKLLASPRVDIRQQSLILSGIFMDPEALTLLRKTVADAKESNELRQTALQTLIESKAGGIPELLRALLADTTMRGPAIRGLAAVADPGTPELILGLYAKLSDTEKRDALATLASRPVYAMALLDGIEKQRIPRRDVSAYMARQILNLKNKPLAEKLRAVWGTIESAPRGDKAKLVAKYKAIVPPDVLTRADRVQGRVVFTRTCATCHALFNEGGKIAPELTGAQRTNPEYILTKLIDPSYAVPRDFQVIVFELNSGRVVNGIVTQETNQTVTVQTINEVVRLAKSDIDKRTHTKQSLMPDGMLSQLSEAEIRNLIAYLAGATQVPLPPGAKKTP